MSGFWLGVLGNIVAAALVGVPTWLWKVRPHLDAEREHRADVRDWLAGVHERLDAAGIPDVSGQPGRHATDSETGVMQAVTS